MRSLGPPGAYSVKFRRPLDLHGMATGQPFGLRRCDVRGGFGLFILVLRTFHRKKFNAFSTAYKKY